MINLNPPIRRVIVEDMNGTTILSSTLVESCSESELAAAFAARRLHVLGINVDSVGVALVRIYGTYRK